MSNEIAVGKIGVNVLTATDPNDFIFHSDYNTFKIILSGLVTFTIDASATITGEVVHGLSFTPLVRGFAKKNGQARVFLPNGFDVSSWTANTGMNSSGINFDSISSDATSIYFKFTNTTGSPIDVTVRYYCLEDIAITSGTANNGVQSGNKVIVAKPTFNALTELDPRNLKFSSDYGTLKYFAKINQIATFTANGIVISARQIYTHNLGYYPYVDGFVRVYIGAPSGDFEPAPFFGSGAAVAYNAGIIVKENTIEMYGEINGVSVDTWNFEFLLFLHRNDLEF